MRSAEEYDAALELIRSGQGASSIARLTGIPRSTVRYWRARPERALVDASCPVCGKGPLDHSTYAYLLGLYLGDGNFAAHARGVFRLRISLDARYPGIIDECAQAMAVVSNGRRVARQRAPGCFVVGSYWKHWPCVLPQVPAPRHAHRIRLAPWQEEIATAYPARLLRGLIQSDGCRVLNHVNGKAYPRYHFVNHSNDLLRIFCDACDKFGVHWTQPTWKQISVARAGDVAKLDSIVGPKA